MDDRFTPSRITVLVGTKLTWTNTGNNQRTTSSVNGLWDSGLLAKGGSFSFTFTSPGTYRFICRQHLLQGMIGTFTVEIP